MVAGAMRGDQILNFLIGGLADERQGLVGAVDGEVEHDDAIVGETPR